MKKFFACMLAGLTIFCVSACNQKGEDSSSASGDDSSMQQPEIVRTVTEAEWNKALSAESFKNVTLKQTQTWGGGAKQVINTFYIWENGFYSQTLQGSDHEVDGIMNVRGEDYGKGGLTDEIESGDNTFGLPPYSLFIYNEERGAYEYIEQKVSYAVFFENGVYIRHEYESAAPNIGRVKMEAYDYGKTQPVDVFKNCRTIDDVLNAWGTYQARYQGTNEVLDEATLQELISLLRGLDRTEVTEYRKYNNDVWNWEYTFAVSGQFDGDAYTELKIDWGGYREPDLCVNFGGKTIILESVS